MKIYNAFRGLGDQEQKTKKEPKSKPVIVEVVLERKMTLMNLCSEWYET